jgi:phosphate transport system substrate-binding protein
MFQQKTTSLVTLALVLALAAVPKPVAAFRTLAGFGTLDAALAQSTAESTPFALPTTVPSGTTVTIDGSTSMEMVNATLKQRFEQEFPGTQVNIEYGGTTPALQALLEGKVDLAAIGRPLTEEETARGLVAIPVARNKIAIVVSANNPFTGSLTDQQFAKIFRGEITNWSEVGGSPGRIRLIDRPQTSDTRQAFQNYPVFKNAPFVTGANAIALSEDSTAATLKELGSDGIGYAIANQVVNQPGVRVVLLHQTSPEDSRYPFFILRL